MIAPDVALDTNAVASLLAREPRFLARLAHFRLPALSSVVIGELWFGALNSGRVEHNLERIEGIVSNCAPLSIDPECAQFYARLRLALKRRGRMIPVNDLWIAATAIRHGLPLLSDDAHFREVEDLDLRGW